MLDAIASLLNANYLDVKAVVAIGLVCIVCGLVGSLVVGNRMAFFSDAMAHTAYAGVALGALAVLFMVPKTTALDAGPAAWLIPLVMVVFGAVVGIAIAFFRERTGLTNDAVIGVFFAFAVGFGAMLIPVLSRRVKFQSEEFLFGSPIFVTEDDLLFLVGLLAVTILFVLFRYNGLVFAGFNPSLARTRRFSVRLNSYLFVLLLSLVVNLSIKAVGVLLINALLVVPAAAAANLARNLRQMFAFTLLISLGSGIAGYALSRGVEAPFPGGGPPVQFGPAGTIIVLTVGCFFTTALASSIRGRPLRGATLEPDA